MLFLKLWNCLDLFRTVGAIADVSASADGLLYCTVAADKALKVFDVVNFGMFLLQFLCPFS